MWAGQGPGTPDVPARDRPSRVRARDLGRSDTCPHRPRPPSAPSQPVSRVLPAQLPAVSKREELCFRPSRAPLPSGGGRRDAFSARSELSASPHGRSWTGTEVFGFCACSPDSSHRKTDVIPFRSSFLQKSGDSLTGGELGGESLRWRKVVPCRQRGWGRCSGGAWCRSRCTLPGCVNWGKVLPLYPRFPDL